MILLIIGMFVFFTLHNSYLDFMKNKKNPSFLSPQTLPFLNFYWLVDKFEL